MAIHPDFEIRRASTSRDWHTVAALLRDYVAWLRDSIDFDPLTEQVTFTAEIAGLGDYYGDDHGAFFVARRGDVPVGHIAIRRHDDGTAELKRMFVSPGARGTGLVDDLVRAALETAADIGCDLVWLESKSGAMDAALAVYRRHGFREVAPRGRTIDIDGLVVMECEVDRLATATCGAERASAAR